MIKQLQKNWIFLLSILLLSCSSEKNVKTLSPNQQIELHFNLSPEGQATYSIYFNKKTIILPSPLGFEFKNAHSLKKGLSLELIKETSVSESWKTVWGEKKIIENSYKHLKLVLREEKGLNRAMVLEFKVYNDGLGFRYTLDKIDNDWESVEITDELTGFYISEDPTVFLAPIDFENHGPLGTKSKLSEFEVVRTPVFCRMADGTHFSIHEAASKNYPALKLTQKQKNGIKPFNQLKTDFFPWPDKVKIKAELPITSPWRTIQITNNADGLLTSNLLPNLNEPCEITNTDWINLFKYIKVNTEITNEKQDLIPEMIMQKAKETIDFAEENKIEAVLFEDWKEIRKDYIEEKIFDLNRPISGLDFEKIITYANSKGISLIPDLEIGGDAASLTSQLDTANFARAHAMGIKAFKIKSPMARFPDGQHHHSQQMVNHLQKMLIAAAKYEIALILPTPFQSIGLSRTWPNLLPEPEFSGQLNDLQGSILAKHLALQIINYSPCQQIDDFFLNPKQKQELHFITQIPNTWDETRIIKAELGNIMIFARQNGEKWFLGALNDGEKRHEEFKMKFLDPLKIYQAEIFNPNASQANKNKVENLKVKSSDYLRVNLPPNGGMAVIFTPSN